MLHPLIRLISRQPELLVEHVGAYADLASAQVADIAEQARDRVVYTAALVVLASVGVALAAVSLLLFAVVPASAMPYPWLLAVVPLLPLAAAFGCWVAVQRRPLSVGFPALRAQWEADQALWRGVAAR